MGATEGSTGCDVVTSRSLVRFSAQANKAFYSFGVGELIPELTGKGIADGQLKVYRNPYAQYVLQVQSQTLETTSALAPNIEVLI